MTSHGEAKSTTVTHKEAIHPAGRLTENRPFTIRVPSYSPLSSLASLSGTVNLIHPRASPGCHESTYIPSFSEAGCTCDKFTIYPEDSVSSAEQSPASATDVASLAFWPRRDLAKDVVEVHDVCLAATQRYLEALHVNWDLRNGEPIPVGAGPVRRNKRAGGTQWSPYSRPTQPPRRRAYSDTDLHELSYWANAGAEQLREKKDDTSPRHLRQLRAQQNRPTNPIPFPTTSLLENIHHICGSIWLQALRNRKDVLGAEAAGCREMKALFDYGETIVLHHPADFEKDPEGCFWRVLEAGVGICTELGDWEGVERLKGAEGGQG